MTRNATRNAAIIADARAGMTAEQIAEKWYLQPHYVKRIVPAGILQGNKRRRQAAQACKPTRRRYDLLKCLGQDYTERRINNPAADANR